MKAKRHDGGQAFPRPTNEYGEGQYGMTLRDWFAGMAMMGTVNHPDAPHFEEAANQAYEMADAMLKSREFIKP